LAFAAGFTVRGIIARTGGATVTLQTGETASSDQAEPGRSDTRGLRAGEPGPDPIHNGAPASSPRNVDAPGAGALLRQSPEQEAGGSQLPEEDGLEDGLNDSSLASPVDNSPGPVEAPDSEPGTAIDTEPARTLDAETGDEFDVPGGATEPVDSDCFVRIVGPPGGRAYWNGTSLGIVPTPARNVSCGTGRVVVKSKKGSKFATRARALSGELTVVRQTPAAGKRVTVRVTSQPTGALVKVGNRTVGRTPTALHFKTGDSALIRVIKPYRKMWSRRIRVRPNTQKINAKLPALRRKAKR